jgi:hypothetical protein
VPYLRTEPSVILGRAYECEGKEAFVDTTKPTRTRVVDLCTGGKVWSGGHNLKNVLIAVTFLALAGSALAQKTYNHASEYQVAVLDESTRVGTGTDATLGKTQTDAKLDGGGQAFHFLHTDHGNYRVEAPVNKGMSFVAAMAAPQGTTPVTYHNKWFLDNVPAGTNVLFAARCGKPNKKHPNDVVRCEFWFPDPDSTSHEYRTLGDFTVYLVGDGSNTQKTANALCGTGKLNPETEKKICSAASTAPAEEAAQ